MKQKKFSMNKLFWGLMFIAGAALLLANRLGYWSNLQTFSIVGIIFTIFFAWIVVQGLSQRNFFLIFLGLSLIAIQYDKLLHITAITPWTLLGAALLASIGLTILFPPKSNHFSHVEGNSNFADKGEKVFQAEDGEVISFKNAMGECVKYVNTDALVNVSLDNTFGSMKIFFDNAVIKNGIANVNVSNSFGETILYVPKTWNVENHMKISFGDFKVEGVPQTPGCPTLRIYGSNSFGDTRIVYI